MMSSKEKGAKKYTENSFQENSETVRLVNNVLIEFALDSR